MDPVFRTRNQPLVLRVIETMTPEIEGQRFCQSRMEPCI